MFFISFSQDLAVLKYKGGGDWYSNPTALPNLIKFCNQNIKTKISEQPQTVETGSTDIFQYPLLHMTGHGNVFFNEDDAENLRNYLISGGFLHIDDNYGMEPFLKKELKKVFQMMNWLKFQQVTLFLILFINSQMDYQKYMSTMVSARKL